MFELTNGCPACMLAAVRQQDKGLSLTKDNTNMMLWSFKEESAQWMREHGNWDDGYDC